MEGPQEFSELGGVILGVDSRIPSHVSGKQDGRPALLGSWYDHGLHLLGCADVNTVMCVIA